MRSETSSNLRRLFPCTGAPVYLAGAHDALSAGLAIRAGFAGVWASSFGIATSRLEVDANTLRRSSIVTRVREMTAVIAPPIIVDAGTGFEAEGGLQITVRAFGRAGAFGACLEDKRDPRRNSLVAAAHDLLSIEEMTAKLELCVRSRLRNDFLILARTDSLSSGEDIPKVRERLIRYSKSGIDGVVLHVREEKFDILPSLLAGLRLSVPLGAILCALPPPPIPTVAKFGLAFCVLPHLGIRTIVPALENAFAEPNGEPQSSLCSCRTVPEIDHLVRELQPTVTEVQSSATIVCAHRSQCLNFRRDGPTYCSSCGTTICRDHYHDDVKRLRLCDDCFAHHLPNLDAALAEMTPPENEPEDCYNSPYCYSFGTYLLHVPKECSSCGQKAMRSHFHDVAGGKRLCLECFKQRQNSR